MNSETISTHYGRFKDLPWFDPMQKMSVMIGGAGGIGSHLAFMLARTGVDIFLFDYDQVDDTNLAGQLFGREDVGKPKVVAATDVIRRLCGDNKVRGLNMKLTPENKDEWMPALRMSSVTCVVFDNIKTRKMLYEAWEELITSDTDTPRLFVDGRMAAEDGEIHCIDNKANKLQHAAYKATFFDDEEVAEQPCSAKATTHCGSLIAALITSQITNWVNDNLLIAEEGKTIVVPRVVAPRIEFHLQLGMINYIASNRPASTVILENQLGDAPAVWRFADSAIGVTTIDLQQAEQEVANESN